RGIILDDKYYDSLRSYADASRTVSYSKNFSDKKLKTLRWIGVALFYSSAWARRPLRPFKMIMNVLRGTQESRSEMALANMLRRKTLANDAGVQD
ncbi:MAG: hypothetical protein ISR53_01315, partial [Rhodospirillales bacterium]|nr:hypothetical protein [Rhodospirillales bacterium]